LVTDKSSRILAVVDDDLRVRRSLEQLFRSAGMEHILFSSAAEILSSNKLSSIGCLVTDVRMPGMNGCELQQRLGSIVPDLPVIFLTAHQDDDVRNRALRQGAFAFLQKPFDGEELLSLVKLALGSSSTTEVSDVDR